MPKLKKLPVWDNRMLLLMHHCIDSHICDSQKDFLLSIDFNPGNLTHVKSARQSFTIEQISKACKLYKVSPSWILGFSNEMKFEASKSALQILKDAVRNVEAILTK